MAHYMVEIKKNPNALYDCNIKEILQLRIYVQYHVKIKKYEEAKKALQMAISLNNQILYRCSIPEKLRQKLMAEGMVDMKAYENIARYVNEDQEMKNKGEKIGEEDAEENQPIIWQPNPNLPTQDAKEGFKRFSPFLTIPGQKSSQWTDIIGHDEPKEFIEAALVNPILYKSLYKNEKSPRGVLLYGPPGTGKTMLASSIASKVGLPFIELKCSEMKSKWLGQTEENIRYMFALANHLKPCVLFLDEVDSLAGQRDAGGDAPESGRSITNQLLTSMDASKGVFVVAATNFPWQIDSAFARRLSRKIYIPLPTKKERFQCIKKRLETVPNNLLEIDIHALNEELDFASNDDILKWMDGIVAVKKVAKLKKCHYFAKTKKGVWYPTTRMNPSAVKVTFLQLEAKGETVREVNFSLIDFETSRPEITSSEEKIEKYEEYRDSLTDPTKKFSAMKKMPTYQYVVPQPPYK